MVEDLELNIKISLKKKIFSDNLIGVFMTKLTKINDRKNITVFDRIDKIHLLLLIYLRDIKYLKQSNDYAK